MSRPDSSSRSEQDEREAKHEKLWDLLDREPNIDILSLTRAFAHHLEYTVCKYRDTARGPDIYQALAFTVRDFLIDRWNQSQRTIREEKAKRLYYISMEFLMGRLLDVNLVNTGMRSQAAEALEAFGFDLAEIRDYEPDAGLGNGGLGRLAACFLESIATLNLPGSGSSIRYEFGIFHQQIVEGYQKEAPDAWLSRGNPWEIQRHDIRFGVNFYGHTERYVDDAGVVRSHWVPGESVIAQAYDILQPGFDTRMVTHLRLWGAQAGSEFNFDYFNHGDYIRAVEDQLHSETISRVLYPNENIQQGKELRLKQEYLLVSATIQDALATFRLEEKPEQSEDWDRLPDRVFFQMNDTHPALAVPELMRILVDEHQMDWDRAFDLTVRCLGYTNHTVLPEALEKWDVEMFGSLLPRHLEIIYEINQNFLEELRARGVPDEIVRSLSIVEEGQRKNLRMANLACVGSSAVNGVAALHTEIIKERVFQDFHRLWPDKIQNKTNGITHRRWLTSANDDLANLIAQRIGGAWQTDLERIQEIETHATDPEFQADWRRIKLKNKERLAKIIHFECGVAVDPRSIFDIQIKRIHEYKRQHLNVLRIIHEYQRMKTDPAYRESYTPRTVIFAGKAAPGYHRARMIIKLICSVGDIVNNDPDTNEVLKVIFLPNYRVSLAERMFPAADISEQISTAGMEASGTGNMKFMLSGALTVGTLDGANVEIVEEVGSENAYIFGLTADEIRASHAKGYDPVRIYEENRDVRHVLDAIRGNYFNRKEPGIFQELFHSLVYGGDFYHLLADFDAYRDVQARIAADFHDEDAWTRKSILNTAHSGRFSSDRTIREYARDIWGIDSLELRQPRVRAQ
ncbi:MAG: glycogen/starch/alpha-glucan phosphorylase [bacterium]|nr:glycogen/starch/alpha-glucan phosphorylase [bacterium]